MEDIGKDELLMLLLVVDAEFDQGQSLGRWVLGEQALDRLIHMLAVLQNIAEGGMGEGSALLAQRMAAESFVIGVEQETIFGIED